MELINFEHLKGVSDPQLSEIISSDPTGKYVALQELVQRGETNMYDERTSVWDAATGRIVWFTADTTALAWFPSGTDIILIREHFEGENNDQEYMKSTYSCERYTWPDKRFVQACPITPLYRQPVAISVSPREDIALFYWTNQGISGFGAVALQAEPMHQVHELGHQSFGMPAFSPSGRYMVYCWQQIRPWWNRNPYLPCEGGIYEVGQITIIDLDTSTQRNIPVQAEIPSGWIPKDLLAPVHSPEFIDEYTFEVTLPTEESRIYKTN
jgi:hypothetical protein